MYLSNKLIVGFGEACRIASRELDHDEKHITRLYHKLKNGLIEKIPHIKFNGDLVNLSQIHKKNN